MWQLDDGLEDSSIDQIEQRSDENLDMNLSPSMFSLLDSDQTDPEPNDSAMTPLPCPCSVSTLESHDSSSSVLAQCIDTDPDCSELWDSDQITRNDANDHQRGTARQIQRGVLVGTVLSLFFVAYVVTYASDSTLRWISTKHHQMRMYASGPTRSNNIGHQGYKADIQPKASPPSTGRHRQLRDKTSYMDTVDRALAGDLHDVALDGELVKQFFNRHHKAHVYHANETMASKRAQRQSRRKLQTTSSSSPSDPSSDDENKKSIITPPKDPQLVVAGKLTVADGPCNVAQMNLKTGEWSLQQRIQLSLYNSYSGGEVYSLLANHTIAMNSNAKEFRAEGTSSKER
jgi:hypothetical protein